MKHNPHAKLFRRLAAAGVIFLLVVLLGSLGYWLITGMRYSALDCVYMTVITITTVGFTEIVDLSESPGGRIFTMFLALSGVGTVTYLLSNITAFLVEGELSDTFRRRKMEKKAKQLEDHYIVCGVGKVGLHIALELSSTKRRCVAIDRDSKSLQDLAGAIPDVIYFDADATDNDTLLAAGIERARGLFAVTDDDNQNLVIGLSARHLNPRLRIVSRCRELKNVDKLKASGVDAVISPSLIGGLRMASEMIRPSVVSFLDIMLRDKQTNLRIESVSVALPGTRISDLGLDKFGKTLLLAVETESGWVHNPPNAHVLDERNTLVVMTTPDDRAALERHLASRRSRSERG